MGVKALMLKRRARKATVKDWIAERHVSGRDTYKIITTEPSRYLFRLRIALRKIAEHLRTFSLRVERLARS